MSPKNKTLILVATSVLLFSIILLFTIYTNQKAKLESIEQDYYQNIKSSYGKILERHNYFYKHRLIQLINTPGLKEALNKKDREKLYKIAKSQFETLKQENEYLKVMHFHLANGDSFLRMHQKEDFGDNIAQKRPMADSVHKTQKPLNGFEAGNHMLGYREFMPIFYKDKYIGAVELGSRPDQVLAEMKYLTNINGALFVKADKLLDYKEDSNIKIGNYVLQYNSLDDKELVKLLPKDYNFESIIEIKNKNKTYAIYPFCMKDHNGTVVAKAVYFHDITSIKNAFANTVIKLIILLLILMTVLGTVINFGFSAIIKKLQITNTKLKESEFRWNFAVDGRGDGLWDWNIKTNDIYFSPMWKKMLGYSDNEIKNDLSEWSKRVKPEQLENVQLQLQDYFDGKTSHYESEYQMLCADGSYKWLLDRGVIVKRDADNKPIRMIGTHTDISKRKEIESRLIEQKLEFEAIVHTSKDGIAIVDLDTKFLFFNDAYLKMTGFSKEELLTKTCAELSAPEDIANAKEAILQVIHGGFLENFNKTCIVKNSKRLKANISLALMPDKKRILISAKDMTEAKVKEKQIADYVELINQNIITSTTDLEGTITQVSEAFCKISGYSKEELIGQNHRIIRHPDMPKEVYDELWAKITNNEVWQGEIKNLKKDQNYYWVYATLYPIFDECGQKIGYTGIRQDITDKKLIEQLSITDGLTGIYNRRYFNDKLPKLINQAKRNSELIAFGILDIDYFKQYNDTYGHKAGDDVIISVATTLQNSLKRADDYCFRLGGEEFGVVFKPTKKEHAMQIAQSIRQNIEELSIIHASNTASAYVTISMGLICDNANNINSIDELYKNADEFLYLAKTNGRNKVYGN